MLRKSLFKWILPKILSHSCDSRIPRSGIEGTKVNCYTIMVDKNKLPFLLVSGYREGRVVGKKWKSGRFSNPFEMDIEDIDIDSVRVTHYYGLHEVLYTSVFSLTWNYISKFKYIGMRISGVFNSMNQSIFNRRQLETKRRMELLEFMIKERFERGTVNVGIVELMTKLYSIRWLYHPSRQEQKNKLKFHLESLIESGDVIFDNGSSSYRVLGKAISTIERYEEEERRHTESVRTQKRMVALTFLIAILALVQSGLIKMPTILDLS